MSAHVHTAHPELHSGSYLSLDAYRPEVVNVGIGSGPDEGVRSAGINVPRADFLAAVSSELGVVIIDKATYPPIEPHSADADLCGIGTFSKSSDPEALEREGIRYFAYAEHLRAHPPVAEAAVNAILSDMVKAPAGTPDAIARHLAALGYEKAVRS